MSRKRRIHNYQRLLFPLGDDELREEVERRSGLKVRLKVTENRSSMVRVSRASDGSARVRAHRIFLYAPRPVLRALGSFVRSPRSRPAREVLSTYIRAEDDQVSLCGPRAAGDGAPASNGNGLRARGACFDLAEIFDRLNREHFGGQVKARITWGRARRGAAPRRTIHFGTFERDGNGGVIRIHPAIDRAFVPRCFVEFVVYHEMLHERLPIERGPNGRRIVHSKEFRARELAFPLYEQAKRWERNNLHRFLRGDPGRVSRSTEGAASRFGLTAH